MKVKYKKNSQQRTIYRFFFEVLGWLLICLFAWFVLARILNIPLIWLAKLVFPYFTDGVISDVQMYYSSNSAFQIINQQFILKTIIPPPGELPVNAITSPLIFGYGLPTFMALTLATSKSEKRKWLEIGFAYIIFLLVQLFGITTQALMQLVFYSPPEIYNYFPLVRDHLDILGVSSQIATLLLPSMMPLVLWISFNTAYIEKLVGRRLTLN